jgi:cyclophilin family peptidyl-prolyl cis-trans isomerase
MRDERIDFGKLPAGVDKYEVRKIDSTGRVRRQIKEEAERLVSKDVNSLHHDSAGLVSVRKGQKTFEFTITTGPSTSLDASNVVVGKVLSGMDVVDLLNTVPVTQEDVLGSKSRFADAGKGFDPRAKLISLQRPLEKIIIKKAGVL